MIRFALENKLIKKRRCCRMWVTRLLPPPHLPSPCLLRPPATMTLFSPQNLPVEPASSPHTAQPAGTETEKEGAVARRPAGQVGRLPQTRPPELPHLPPAPARCPASPQTSLAGGRQVFPCRSRPPRLSRGESAALKWTCPVEVARVGEEEGCAAARALRSQESPLVRDLDTSSQAAERSLPWSLRAGGSPPHSCSPAHPGLSKAQ